jgi:phosphomannomutase/phosphoglucomutase
MYCDVDGHFPNHHPDPSKPENLADLVKLLGAGKHDLGLAFDGDGDRLGVVTRQGHVIYPDRQLMLFAADVYAPAGATVIYDVKSTQPEAVDHSPRRRADALETGHSLIKSKMKEVGALAGEMGYTFSPNAARRRRRLYAGARLLEILSRHANLRRARRLVDAVSTPELNIARRG